MLVFLLIVLLLAVTGLLGAVLKLTAVLVLSIVLALTILAVWGWWMVRRGMRRYADGSGPGQGSQGGQGPANHPGSGNVIDTQGRIKREGSPDD